MKKIYYGWVVLLALFFVYSASNGFGFNTLPVWYPSLTQEFGLAKGEIASAPFLMLLVVAFLSPIFGLMLDRLDTRKVMWVGGLSLSVLFFAFSFLQNFTQLKIFYVLYGLALCAGGILTSLYFLNRWFAKSRGLAVGIFLNASSLGAAIFSVLAGKSITAYGWRDAAFYFSFVLIIMLILPQFWLKNKPDDNDELAKAELQTGQSGLFPAGIPLKNVLKMPTFYIFLLITGTLWYCINGVLFNKDIYLTDLGKTTEERGVFGMLFFIFGFLGKLLFGYLSDKLDKKYIMMFSIASLAIGCWVINRSLTDVNLVNWVAIVFGVGYSGAFTMIQVLIADYFMGKNYGIILGIFTMIDTLAGSAGIIMMGKARQYSGSFSQPFSSMLVLCLLALAATLFIRKPSISHEINPA
jgi:MFS transporter, OFA family, oxalate/formate antiporter